MNFEKISYEQYISDGIDKIIPYEDIRLPERSTKHSAGYDFYSLADATLTPGNTLMLPTGIKVKLDPDKWLMIVPRSGIGFNSGVMLMNTVGVIDADYYNNSRNEGHIWIKLKCPEDSVSSAIRINKGDSVCQGIILPYCVTDDDNSSGERSGGFGSTGHGSSM